MPAAEVGPDPTGVVRGVVRQHAWNLVWIGLAAAAVGARLNWRNSRAGHALNFALVGLADAGFLAALVRPGYVRRATWVPGPALWLLGAAFTTAGLRSAPPRRSDPRGEPARAPAGG